MPNSVFCSFCEEEFPSSKHMMDHLMMCGNKTDQCPNCRKYVRRAVFVYHYENDCADIDASPSDDNTQSTTQSEKPVLVSIKCQYCGQNCDRSDLKVHRKNCLHNPENRGNNQPPFNDDNFNRSSDRSHKSNEDVDDNRIPCEWCNELVSWDMFENHTIACRDKEHRRLEEKHRHNNQHAGPTTTSNTTVAINAPSATYTHNNRRAVPNTAVTIKTPSATDTAPCKHCGRYMSVNGISYHELVCTKNAKRNKN